MVETEYDELVEKQFRELKAKYEHLDLHRHGNGYSISGYLGFSAEYQGTRIQEAFLIFIKIPDNYPKWFPTVKEMGSRIPRDFHHNAGETLCLATPADQWIKFNETKSLLGFVDSLVVPYLFSFCYKAKTGKMPFGERSHYGFGILEFYQEYFELKDFEAVRKLLKLLATGGYSRNKTCPCGSGKRLKSCHGHKFLEIMRMPVDIFRNEYQQAQFLGEKKFLTQNPIKIL